MTPTEIASFVAETRALCVDCGKAWVKTKAPSKLDLQLANRMPKALDIIQYLTRPVTNYCPVCVESEKELARLRNCSSVQADKIVEVMEENAGGWYKEVVELRGIKKAAEEWHAYEGDEDIPYVTGEILAGRGYGHEEPVLPTEATINAPSAPQAGTVSPSTSAQPPKSSR